VPQSTARRWCLTLALTGTALAVRTEDDSRLYGDVSMMGYPRGCVRGRTLRLGKASTLFDGAGGATGFAVIGMEPGSRLLSAPRWTFGARLKLARREGHRPPPGCDWCT
jgi:hypothetical protein